MVVETPSCARYASSNEENWLAPQPTPSSPPAARNHGGSRAGGLISAGPVVELVGFVGESMRYTFPLVGPTHHTSDELHLAVETAEC